MATAAVVTEQVCGDTVGVEDQLSTEAIAYFKRRRLKAGHCINHCRVLSNIPADVGLQAFMNLPDTDRFRLCQGPMVVTHADRPYLHCWIESGEVVIDLTQKQRFFDKRAYYSQRGVVATEVKRYTVLQMYELGGKAGGAWSFWEFDRNRERYLFAE